ncbi:unnamed protein product [Oikopleura dioica]|uniref:Uncharacterized protein n=1 Tax=Oikopleura dioica TaxID=34765 RepID=E4YCN5_OIKDI|nr:unnamed protein product [Oikopleura dioica]
MENHIVKVLRRVNIRPFAFKYQMTLINQMIASTKSSSCLIPFDDNQYGAGRFQSWFAENEKFSSNPCKLMDAFQTGLQRLAMEFACLDGIKKVRSHKWEDKIAKLTDRVC